MSETEPQEIQFRHCDGVSAGFPRWTKQSGNPGNLDCRGAKPLAKTIETDQFLDTTLYCKKYNGNGVVTNLKNKFFKSRSFLLLRQQQGANLASPNRIKHPKIYERGPLI
ncbi:MAG TPA: hypothetical protein PK629_10725 [Oscillospiraceae bacterium]|nr:hypothetical protein [Oscillospiraceae bacterium]HPF56786.1 hypothetical protein [Clostridiales bacterium]HPK36176.1 hypothetical protein [Oscillospiraceae bacterium]HPR76214.1 hypothetical protein [Oscillospiraceae bacterium]